jgi:NAD(P)-dependent dehydrogenase (short-subunit alcohol dehydrogenase family)
VPRSPNLHAALVCVVGTGAFEATVRAFGEIDMVFNNAGVVGQGFDALPKVIGVNLTAVVSGTALAIEVRVPVALLGCCAACSPRTESSPCVAVLQHMRRSGKRGQIINTASIGGLFVIPFGESAFVDGMMPGVHKRLALLVLLWQTLCMLRRRRR